jgi:putative sigma-54 modulation protein
MKINITARHFKARDSLQNYANEKIALLGKYNEDIMYADVVFSFDKPPINDKHCEIKIKLRDKTLATKETSDEFSKAVDKAIEKIEIQLHRYKDKNKTQKYKTDKEIYKTI